jgi:predicted Ser/Thr protein kinase
MNTEHKKILLKTLENIKTQLDKQIEYVESFEGKVENRFRFNGLATDMNFSVKMCSVRLLSLRNILDSDIKTVRRTKKINNDLYLAWIRIIRKEYSDNCEVIF